MMVCDMQLFPNNDIHKMFHYFNMLLFDGKLAQVTLFWSDRLYNAAGLCSFYGTRDGRPLRPVSISLSKQLLYHLPQFEVVNVLVHEMIHAEQFVERIFEDNAHGPLWMNRAIGINQCFGLRITQYHYGISDSQLSKQLQLTHDRRNNTFMGSGRTLDDYQNEIVDLTKTTLEIIDIDDRIIEIIDDEIIDLSDDFVTI